MTENKETNLQKMQKFFDTNIKIKKILAELMPDERYLASEQYMIEHNKKMYNGVKDLKFYFEEILTDFGMNDYKDRLKDLIKSTQYKIAEAGSDYRRLQNVYDNFLSCMRPNIVDEINAACTGHALMASINMANVMDKVNTFNEFLHLIHSQILNDEKIYNKMPLLEENLASNFEECKLYGIDTELAKIAFQAISSSIGVGQTDVLSINENHVICMIRDKGHALMIDVNKNDDIISVKYHIPKICNLEMINGLKGVRKIDERARYANGNFEVNKENFGLELLTFVSNVPEDGHSQYGKLGTQHFSVPDIMQKMDFPHFVDFIQNNPVVYKIYNIDKYTKEKYEYELNKAKKEQDEMINDGSSIDKIERSTFKIKDILNAGDKVGLNKDKETIGLETVR